MTSTTRLSLAKKATAERPLLPRRALVAVQPVLAGHKCTLVVVFCFVYCRRWYTEAEHAQEAELEVTCVGAVTCAEAPQCGVAAVAVSSVGGPSAEDSLTSVGLTDVEATGTRVGDEVDALNGFK